MLQLLEQNAACRQIAHELSEADPPVELRDAYARAPELVREERRALERMLWEIDRGNAMRVDHFDAAAAEAKHVYREFKEIAEQARAFAGR